MTQASILIVEDKSIVAMDIASTLKHLGYRIAGIADSGEDAVQKTEETQPDLVLMDIMLRGEMDGVDAAGEINRLFNIPVVYLTAYADGHTFARARATAPFGYLIKPFEERELHTTLETALYRHELEVRRKESEQWLATTLKSLGDAVIATGPDGIIKLINPVAQELTGWNEDEAIGKRVEDVLRFTEEKSGEPMAGPVAESLRRGMAVTLEEGTILRARGGRQSIIGGNAAPILDEKGSALGVVMVFQDFTEKRRIAGELLRIQMLESMGVVAGGIAHVFNDILSAVLGYISVSRIEASQWKREFESLDRAVGACHIARDLASQLLTICSNGEAVMKTGFIAKVIKDSVSYALKGMAISYNFNVPDDLWPVEIDKGQVRQAISNVVLFTTGIMPEDGEIQVSASNVAECPCQSPPQSISMARHVMISIHGNGEGISWDELPHIFNPDFMIGRGVGGVGLAVAYTIMGKHGGHITVESGEGGGTTFHLYIPASDKEVVEARYHEGNFPTGKGSVLIMDGESILRDVLGRLLKYLGYDSILARDVKEALLYYKNAVDAGEGFDAVIVDMAPAEENWKLTALDELRAVDPGVKVIVSYDYCDEQAVLEYKRGGFCGLIRKPYDIEELGWLLHEITLG